VNHQVCHGIPNEKALKKGDVVNIDVTVIKNTWHGDTSRMFMVGESSIAAKRLCSVTYEAMWHGIRMVKPGIHLGDIGFAIQRFAEGLGYSVVREFCGHGIGQVFHEEPQVLHYGRPGTLDMLREGMTFTIEPMINAGRKEIKDGPEKDGWTIVTADRSLSAQWEHTVLVTPTGYEVMTLSAGSPPPPAFVAEASTPASPAIA
jgi:methionyl aminopeptidase